LPYNKQPNYGGAGAPTDSGYTNIYSTGRAFTAVKADGSITAWGFSDWGGANGFYDQNEFPSYF
jgi:hypothetical protein